MIVFKSPLKLLADHGWNVTRLIREKQISNGTIARLRHGLSVSTDTIGKICELCNCQPNDVMHYQSDKQGE